DLQHSFTLLDWNEITWGGGYRAVDYRIDGTPTLFFIPPARTLGLGNVFLQDSISLSPSVKLILGIKGEDDPFSDWTALPSARLSWKASEKTLLWAAISRAIRSPTPFETDVVEKLGSTVFLVGNPNFQSEKLTAYEAGL